MKKITFLFMLLTFSFGFSQDLLLGFEDSESGGLNGGPFGNSNALQVNLVTDAGTNGTQVAEFIANSSGEIWQGININLTETVDLTSTQTMTIDVKSATAITFLVKVNGGLNSAPEAAAAVTHNGDNTWQTLSFTFNTSLDGKAAMADGAYETFVIHAYWAPGATVFGDVTADERTFYVDNISGQAYAGPGDPEPATAAPSPTIADNQVLSVYGDTGGFTNIWTPDYSFGTNQGEIELGSPNKALKMNFAAAGYGQGTDNPVDISEHEWVHLDYYAPDVPAGANGHEFKFILIGQGEGEKDYTFKADASGDDTIVFDSWQSVDIPLSHYTALGLTKPNYLQYKLGSTSDLNTTIVYFDNIYFWSNEALSVDSSEITSIKIYPNPTNGVWNLQSNSIIRSIAVYDILGKQVVKLAPNSSDAKISSADIKSGVYFAKLESDNGYKTIKLIKE